VIRRVDSDADRAGFAAVWNAITPREPITGESIAERWVRQAERLYLVAERDGRVAGAGMVAPSDSPGRIFMAIRVLPEARRQGVGAALYDALEAHALALDPGALSGHVAEDDQGAIGFAERRGFREIGRQIELVRELGGDEQPPASPAGIEIVELTEAMHPAAYEITKQAWADFPLPEPVEAPAWDDWVAEEFDGPVAFAALEDGSVVGFAALMGRPAAVLLEHRLTACLRTHRGRGIGTALKQTQIAWAAEHGYRELITFTQEGNEAMRRVNEKLGYVEQPAWLMMRRDLA
jgi:GNAT superfamily N-acetyltransferase